MILFVIFLWAFSWLCANIIKMVALRYDKVTRLAPIYYFEPVFGLILDVLLYKESFVTLQLIGILIVFTVFSYRLVEGFTEKDEEKS